MRGRAVSKGDIVSGGAETEQGWGTIGHPGVERAFRGQEEEGVGLPVKTEAADSREVIGALGDSGRDHGIQQVQKHSRLGSNRSEDTDGSPAATTPHRNSFRSRFKSGSGRVF